MYHWKVYPVKINFICWQRIAGGRPEEERIIVRFESSCT